MQIRNRRLSLEREQELGALIRAAEDQVHEALRGIAVSDRVLGRRAAGTWRTRAERVVQLGAAVDAVADAARHDRRLVAPSRRAKAAWAEAERLRWELAMSASHVVGPEAAKIARVVRVDAEDLQNEGTIGLYDAAVRFEPGRAIRFATYAKWWARARMTRAVDRGGREVRLSGVAVEQRRRLRQVEHELSRAGGPAPSLSEIAEHAGVTVGRARELMEIGEVISIDSPVDEGPKTRRLHDVLASELRDPEDDAGEREALTWLRGAVDEIPDDRRRHVLRRRFGLDGADPKTLSEVGAEIGLSRERVRQIERDALAELRTMAGLDVVEAA